MRGHRMRFGNTMFGQFRVDPSGETVVGVIGAFAVSNECESSCHAGFLDDWMHQWLGSAQLTFLAGLGMSAGAGLFAMQNFTVSSV